jgi:hypothetical protein
LALYIFEQSLVYLQEYFSGVRISIVYLPAFLSSYNIVSPSISMQTYEGRDETYPAERVREMSDMLASRIEEIALTHHIDFIDSRPAIWKGSKSRLLHGPLDYKHFNKEGYTAVAEAVIDFLRENDKK